MTAKNIKNHSTQSFMRRKSGGRIMLIILSILLAFTLIIVAILLALSPGKTKPFLNENGKVLAGSISEKIHVSINGV